MQDCLNKDATSGSKPVFASRSLKCSRIAWCYINVCLCLNVSQQWCAGILDFNNKKTASWSRKVIHLYLVLIRSHLEYCSQFWSPVQDAVKQMWLQNSQGWSTCSVSRSYRTRSGSDQGHLTAACLCLQGNYQEYKPSLRRYIVDGQGTTVPDWKRGRSNWVQGKKLPKAVHEDSQALGQAIQKVVEFLPWRFWKADSTKPWEN